MAFDALLKKQGGRCAICWVIPTKGIGRETKLAVDHCHATGRVRGLLCMNCNVGLGLFKDSQARLAMAIAYLRTHQKPASVSGGASMYRCEAPPPEN